MNTDILENNENIENRRQNPFCVISIATYGEYEVHDIQINSAWDKNPYGKDYAIVPDDLVQDIMETRGFCDIVLNEEGTEVVSFTAREIPIIEVPETEYEPTAEEILNAIAGGLNNGSITNVGTNRQSFADVCTRLDR
jgi:hypothetical protein